jgi:phage terminase large subunit-like protein
MPLAEGFLEAVTAKYAGSAKARQELAGEFVLDAAGALWTWTSLDAARRAPAPGPFDRVVVAVDPPVTGGEGSDECGIIVAGVRASGPMQDWTAEVIADGSVRGLSPQGWAERAVRAFHEHGADRLVAETNQGGEMVRNLIASVDASVPFSALHAIKGKSARAEPVAALYEQGRVRHGAAFAALEDQMLAMTAGRFAGRGSPDRLDALVWAITELLIVPIRQGIPHVRGLGRGL